MKDKKEEIPNPPKPKKAIEWDEIVDKYPVGYEFQHLGVQMSVKWAYKSCIMKNEKEKWWSFGVWGSYAKHNWIAEFFNTTTGEFDEWKPTSIHQLKYILEQSQKELN